MSSDDMSTRSTAAHQEEQQALPLPHGMLLGENDRPAFAGTDSKCLDFFFKVVPTTPHQQLRDMIQECWDEDRNVALRLIFNTGNVRGGKQDKTNFFRSMIWLWEQHPETFMLNLNLIAEHTSLKSVLDLLMYIIHKDEDTRFNVEGALLAAATHKQLRESMRGALKKKRRQERRARQAAVKQEFAAARGVSDIRELRRARLQLSRAETRVAKGACVYCGEQGHWKESCPTTKERRPAQPRHSRVDVDEEAEEPIDWETAVFVGRSSKGQMARMMKQLEIQRSAAEEAIKENCYLTQQRRRRAKQCPIQPEANATPEQDMSMPVTMRWYACTQWESAAVAGSFHDFIQSRDAAYAASSRVDAKQQRQAAAQVAARRLDQDSMVKRLHDAVAQLFADGLQEEMRRQAAGESVGGLFGKWAPTPGYLHDTATLIADAIAARLFAGEVGDGQDQRRRCRYRKEVLSALRAAAKIPEHFLGKGAWGAVEYERLPSRCRLLYGSSLYGKRDPERYVAHLVGAAREAIKGSSGKGVKAAAILPHELTEKAQARLAQLTTQTKQGGGERVEAGKVARLEDNLLWLAQVQACQEARCKGGQGLMVPVCDVSGSMHGTPMEVAVALSLLLAESAPKHSPWHGKMFTFHTRPSLVTVPGIPTLEGLDDEGLSVDALVARVGDVGERVRFVKGIEWGGSTDVDAVFFLLLQTANDAQLAPDEVAAMSVIIFSDMEFDQARVSDVPWETAHEAIAAAFRDAGYPAPPTLVYWNLRASRSVPVDSGNTPGVVLLSGFSAAMMTSFLAGQSMVQEDSEEGTGREEGRKATGLERMHAMLAKREYEALRVAEEDRAMGWSYR